MPLTCYLSYFEQNAHIIPEMLKNKSQNTPHLWHKESAAGAFFGIFEIYGIDMRHCACLTVFVF
jgi:hypothetical protein